MLEINGKKLDASSYLLGEDEVKLTGRYATKSLPGGKLLTVVEVTPLDDNVGTWKKFIQPTSLLEIFEGGAK